MAVTEHYEYLNELKFSRAVRELKMELSKVEPKRDPTEDEIKARYELFGGAYKQIKGVEIIENPTSENVETKVENKEELLGESEIKEEEMKHESAKKLHRSKGKKVRTRKSK